MIYKYSPRTNWSIISLYFLSHSQTKMHMKRYVPGCRRPFQKKKKKAVDGKFLQTLVEVKIDRKLPYVDAVVKDAV